MLVMGQWRGHLGVREGVAGDVLGIARWDGESARVVGSCCDGFGGCDRGWGDVFRVAGDVFGELLIA